MCITLASPITVIPRQCARPILCSHGSEADRSLVGPVVASAHIVSNKKRQTFLTAHDDVSLWLHCKTSFMQLSEDDS